MKAIDGELHEESYLRGTKFQKSAAVLLAHAPALNLTLRLKSNRMIKSKGMKTVLKTQP